MKLAVDAIAKPCSYLPNVDGCMCRLNIPLFRRRVLKKLRGSIVKVPVVQRYCTPANRLPPVPKWQLPKARVSHHTGLDTGEPAEEVRLEETGGLFGV